MSSIARNPQNFNNQGKSSPAIFSTIDLIDHMLDHHHDQAIDLVEQARWHSEQAAALAAERRALAAAVTSTLAEVEAVLA